MLHRLRPVGEFCRKGFSVYAVQLVEALKDIWVRQDQESVVQELLELSRLVLSGLHLRCDVGNDLGELLSNEGAFLVLIGDEGLAVVRL